MGTRSRSNRLRLLATVLLLALAGSGCGEERTPLGSGAAGDGWFRFTGTWNASGTRRAMALGSGRRAALLELMGTMFLAGPGRPGAGFRAEVIALTDSEAGLTGRSVWTDERGDQVFSELTGEGTAARNRIEGRIFGGTGRFAGATGSYGFSWQSMVETGDGRVQGRAVDLEGRVHLGDGAR